MTFHVTDLEIYAEQVLLICWDDGFGHKDQGKARTSQDMEQNATGRQPELWDAIMDP